MKKILIALLLLFCFSSGSFSDDLLKISPYELDLTKDIILAGSGALLFGSSLLIGNLNPQTPASDVVLDLDDVNSFDSWAASDYNKSIDTFSDIVTLGLIAMPPLLFIGQDWDEIVIIGVMYSEAMLLSFGLKELVKASTTRYRPYSYFNNPSEDYYSTDSADSFFSGHTTFAFTSASFFTKVFSDYYPDSPWKYIVGATSYTLASTVAILRVSSGNHFLSDVIVGAISGTLIGYLVPVLHKVKEEEIDLALYSDADSNLHLTLKFSY